VNTAAITPQQWGSLLAPEPPPLHSIDGGLLRRWRGTAAAMGQPPLDHHYLAQHLGGAKQVQRRGDGALVDETVALGSVTIAPAGSAFRWLTRGPIEFAHLYIAPRRIDHAVRDNFDREPSAIVLTPQVGWEDPLVGALMTAMLDPGLDADPDSRLARDSWFEALLTRLILSGSNLASNTPRARNRFAPRTLARLKRHIADNLARGATLDDLAGVAGLSRFHLCRAFRDSTGLPPHAYLTRARLAAARQLLRGGEVARACSFASLNQFATSFRKAMGVTPTRYRQSG
jgi:AraC family transcriptional regulator